MPADAVPYLNRPARLHKCSGTCTPGQDVIPAGVFNVVTGSGSKAGQYMLEHKGFRKLAFTGSTEVGRDVALAAAQKLIPSTLELGRKIRKYLL